jgi:hypothetical protein
MAAPSALDQFLGKMVQEMGAAMTGALVIVGDKLGLYKALAAEALTPAELADRTGTTERYVREWLAAQAASGYVTLDAAAKKYTLSPEQAMVFANDKSPVFMAGAFEMIGSLYKDEPKISEAFRSGKVSVGTSTVNASSAARSGFSARAIRLIS